MVAVSVTGAVLPLSVSWPDTEATLSPEKVNLSPTNLAVGLLATSKKSLLFRWLSNWVEPVLMPFMSKVISTLPDLPALSNCTVPSFLSKRPRLVEVPKCLISKVA